MKGQSHNTTLSPASCKVANVVNKIHTILRVGLFNTLSVNFRQTLLGHYEQRIGFPKGTKWKKGDIRYLSKLLLELFFRRGIFFF